MAHAFIRNQAIHPSMLLAAMVLLAGMGGNIHAAATGQTVEFNLENANLLHFFPNAADPTLPSYYAVQPGFPQTLAQSIQQYVKSSLQNDGINATATVTTTSDNTQATVTLTANDAASLAMAQSYATVLPQFMDDNHAGLGWSGVQSCQAANTTSSSCWPTLAPSASPWAFYLPLGLPLINQKLVMLLNYPPSDALCSASYLNNASMARWNTVLSTVGIPQDQIVLYETTMDEHPIAAPGSKQASAIANTTPYFYASTTQPNYDQSMLKLLLNPPTHAGNVTLPLQVAGSDARGTWEAITGLTTIKVDQGGVYTWPDGKTTPWIATNHPIFAGYSVCPGDHTDGSNPTLITVEEQDLAAACALKALAADPSLNPNDAVKTCQQTWSTTGATFNAAAFCVQARMDYDYNSVGNCQCQQAAQAFCASNHNNPCPSATEITSCASFNGPCGTTPHYTQCTTPAEK